VNWGLGRWQAKQIKQKTQISNFLVEGSLNALNALAQFLMDSDGIVHGGGVLKIES